MEGAHDVSGPAIAIRDLHLRRASRQVLAGVSLTVGRGEIVALMGASGSGKTTLLRTLAGLDAFDAGTLMVDGVTISGGPRPTHVVSDLRRKVGLVFQFHCLFEHLSVLDNVTLAPLHVQRVGRGEAERVAHALLESLGIDHRAAALPRELSGGEAQRAAIARALATDPPVLLMDEPTASLDPTRRQDLTELLRSLAGQRRTLLLTTHDTEFARATATRMVYLRNGKAEEKEDE